VPWYDGRRTGTAFSKPTDSIFTMSYYLSG